MDNFKKKTCRKTEKHGSHSHETQSTTTISECQKAVFNNVFKVCIKHLFKKGKQMFKELQHGSMN